MKNRAPWELQLIALYRETRENSGRLPYGNFRYYVEDGILILMGGNSTRWLSVSDVEL